MGIDMTAGSPSRRVPPTPDKSLALVLYRRHHCLAIRMHYWVHPCRKKTDIHPGNFILCSGQAGVDRQPAKTIEAHFVLLLQLLCTRCP